MMLLVIRSMLRGFLNNKSIILLLNKSYFVLLGPFTTNFIVWTQSTVEGCIMTCRSVFFFVGS